MDHVCRFLEALVHVKGKWAGQNFKLEPFQVWIVANIFGWIDATTRLRRYRAAFILLPRKQGKTFLASGIGLYMAFADNEAGAEVYCGASNLAQAMEVFRPAKSMAERSPGFTDAFDVSVMARSIFNEVDGQSFSPVIGKTKDGASPHCAICDELHQAKDETQLQAFRTGMGARSQPLLLVISTAGVNLAGVCRAEQLDAEAILRGDAQDDRTFGAIYTLDPGDDWRDIANWRKANPAWGVTVGDDYYQAALAKALQSPANAAFARTKYLNQWVASANAWLSPADWSNAADPDLDIASLKGRKAYLGVDLSTRQDLTAIVAIVPMDDGRNAIIPYALAPEGAIEGSPNAPAYATWVASGELISCEGSASSFAEAESQIEELLTFFNVQTIIFDPWQGEGTRQKFEKRVSTQTWNASNRVEWTLAMDDFEADLKNGRIVHPDHGVLNWCAANTCADQRGVTRIPVKVKKNSEQKIDVMVAALMAYAASCVATVEPAKMEMFFLD